MPNHVINILDYSQTKCKNTIKEFEKIMITKNDEKKLKFTFEKILKTKNKKHWYEEHLNKWGTKWDAYSCFVDTENKLIEFQTAWSAPFGVYDELAKRFPKLSINIKFADENDIENMGEINIKNNSIKILYYNNDNYSIKELKKIHQCIWEYDELEEENDKYEENDFEKKLNNETFNFLKDQLKHFEFIKLSYNLNYKNSNFIKKKEFEHLIKIAKNEFDNTLNRIRFIINILNYENIKFEIFTKRIKTALYEFKIKLLHIEENYDGIYMLIDLGNNFHKELQYNKKQKILYLLEHDVEYNNTIKLYEELKKEYNKKN